MSTSQKMDFSVHEGKIRFGLSAIRNVGEGVVEKIIDSSRADGPFRDFHDFADRVDPCSQQAHRRLSDQGRCLRRHGSSPQGPVPAVRRPSRSDHRASPQRGDGSVLPLCVEATDVNPVRAELVGDEWAQKIKLGFEREMLGLYVSDHPLLMVGPPWRSSQPIAALDEKQDRTTVTIGGLVGAITRRFTKKGELILFFQLEDLEASVEVVLFPRLVKEFGPLVTPDAIVVVEGSLDQRGDDVKVIARSIRELRVRDDSSVRLRISASAISTELVARLKRILASHPGTAPVLLHMVAEDKHTVLRFGDVHRVEPSSTFYAEMKELLGQGAVL